MKRMILKLAGIPEKIHNAITLRYRKVEHGKDFRIRGKLAVYGQGDIRIGDSVRINSKESANPIGGMTKCILNAAKGAQLTIGDRSGLSNCAIVCKKQITIGSDVLIGGNTVIYDTDFHSLDADVRARTGGGTKEAACKPVQIDDGAFVGAHCIILKGVHIGSHAVIGAGSVVTKNVGEGEVWAGNPARFIKKLGGAK